MKYCDWFLKFLNTVVERYGLLHNQIFLLMSFCFLFCFHVSSNINEVIRAVLNFFIQNFLKHKKQKMLTSKQK